MPATTWAPRPVHWTSLIRPPVPVVAPLKGATPAMRKQRRYGDRDKPIYNAPHESNNNSGSAARPRTPVPSYSLNSLIYTGTQLTRGEVMRLCCEDNVSKSLLLPEAAWPGGVLRLKESNVLPLDCTMDTVILDSISPRANPAGPRPPFSPCTPIAPGHS